MGGVELELGGEVDSSEGWGGEHWAARLLQSQLARGRLLVLATGLVEAGRTF